MDKLEVVREVICRVSLIGLNALGRNIVDLVLRKAVVSLECEDCFAVFIKHIDLAGSKPFAGWLK